MAPPSERVDALRERLRQELVDQLADAILQRQPESEFRAPVLRVEAFLGDEGCEGGRMSLSEQQPIISRLIDISEYITPNASHGREEETERQETEATLPPRRHGPSPTSPSPSPTPDPSPDADPTYHSTLSILRPSRAVRPAQEPPESKRQIELSDSRFPKRAKTQPSVPIPQESSIGRLITGIWEQIHGGITLEPRSLLEQWRLTAALTTSSLDDSLSLPCDVPTGGLAPPTPPPSASHSPTSFGEGASAFSQSSALCRRVTQASRTCRSVEVIVQARWTEHFDAYVARTAASNPDLSPTKCHKAALVRACGDFGWSEKELRNRMAVWRGYREIRDAGGWAALVFAGMGIYRFCKYRAGFGEGCMRRLRACRERFEVAADTLHPSWRQLLTIVGETGVRPRFEGHPHDWVVYPDGGKPTPLRLTYLDLDPSFSFEHIDECVLDVDAWGADDPRWMPSSPGTDLDVCLTCGMQQDDDPHANACTCFPTLFPGPKPHPAIQVFHTPTGKRNGIQSLTALPRGTAIGEFVGLVTAGMRDLDVMVGERGGREYQIWQGRQGNFTRFVNHSCRANAQFQGFVWRGTQRVVLVSKGVEGGEEVTVDYSGRYWRGLDKRCLCGEACCRYSGR